MNSMTSDCIRKIKREGKKEIENKKKLQQNCSTGYWIVMTGYSHENNDAADDDEISW